MSSSAPSGFFSFRSDLASRAAALSFTSNFALMIMKLVVGVLTGSIAVLSDGIDSAQDVVASTFAFASIRMGSQPADEEHPYGHGKAESLAAVGQALLIAGGGAYIMVRALQRLIDGGVSINTGPGLIALSVTAVVNVGVAMYVGSAGRRTGSVALKADTRHLWTNVVQALGVVLALSLVVTTGNNVFDPIMALVLAVYLLWTAGEVFMTSLGEVMDVRLPAREVQLVENCLREQRGGVRGYHRLRTRKAGRQRYVDLHLLVDPQATVEVAHAICDEVEDAVCACLPGTVVSIHLEPDDGRYRGPMHDEHVEMGGEGR